MPAGSLEHRLQSKVKKAGGEPKSINALQNRVREGDLTSTTINQPESLASTSKYAHMADPMFLTSRQEQLTLPTLGPVVPKKLQPPTFNLDGAKYLRHALLNAQGGDPLAQQQANAAMRAKAAEPKDVVPPSVLRKRQRTIDSWSLFVSHMHQGLDLQRIWDHDIIIESACFYLRWRVANTTGRFGAEHVKARTLFEWLCCLTYAILKHGRDASTHLQCGALILMDHELYRQMDQEVRSLVVEYNLDRFFSTKVFFGRSELQVLIEMALSRSETHNRIMAIQLVVGLLIGFYTGVRPGTLGYSEAMYKDLGKYLKWKEVKFYRLGHCNWRVEIRFINFKGHNLTVFGTESTFILDGVTKSQNVTFDPCWIVLLAFFRGIFAFNSLEELLSSTTAQLPLNEEKLEEPVFVRGLPGGGMDKETLAPMRANQLTQQLQFLARNAGFPTANWYYFRHGTGNHWGNMLGVQRAGRLLKHLDSNLTVFERSYSAGSANLPAVAIRLEEGNELLGTGDSVHQLDFHHAAVLCLLRRKYAQDILDKDTDMKPAPFATNTRSIIVPKEDVKDVLKNDPGYQAAQAKVNDCWDAFLACFTENAKKYRSKTAQNIRLIWKYYASHKINLVGVTESEAEQASEKLKMAYSVLNARRKESSRQGVRKIKQAKNDAPLPQGVDTTEARLETLSSFKEPSTILLSAVNNFKEQPEEEFAYAPAEISDHVKNLSVEDYAEVESDEEAGEDHQYLSQQGLKLAKKLGAEPPPLQFDNDVSICEENPVAESFDQTNQELEPFNDEKEEDALNLDVSVLREIMMRFIAKPALDQLAGSMARDSFTCPCCSEYTHRPGLANKKYKSSYDVICHSECHTEWNDLEIQMITPDPKWFKCPSCGEKFPPASRRNATACVRKHCLEKCPDRARFKKMHAENAGKNGPRESTRKTTPGKSGKGKQVAISFDFDDTVTKRSTPKKTIVDSSDSEDAVRQPLTSKKKIIISSDSEEEVHELATPATVTTHLVDESHGTSASISSPKHELTHPPEDNEELRVLSLMSLSDFDEGTLDVSGRRHIEDFMERARLLADGVTFHSELDDVLHYDFSELSEFSD